MYFTKEQLVGILKSLTDTFAQGELLVELMRQKMMKENMHDAVKHTNARFGWGIDKTIYWLEQITGMISMFLTSCFDQYIVLSILIQIQQPFLIVFSQLHFMPAFIKQMQITVSCPEIIIILSNGRKDSIFCC